MSSSPSTSTSTPSHVAAKPNPIPRHIPPVLRPLEYMGIPKSVLAWKPRLPSRNWSIFLITVGTLSYAYYDDRRECQLLKQDYVDKVKHLSSAPMKPGEWPRKITVYATRSPGDDDYDKALRYFKRYVKPVLVAAGVDWEVTNGTRHGGLARELQSNIQERRRKLLGLQPWMDEIALMSQTPFSLTPQQQLQREIDGAIVLVGRPAYKEWAWALKNGWCTPLEVIKRDRDDELAQRLAQDHAFDELPVEQSASSNASSPTQFLDQKDSAIAALAHTAQLDAAGAPLPSRFAPTPNKLGSAPYTLGSGANAFNSIMRPSATAAAQAEKKRVKTEAEAAAARVDAKLVQPPTQIPAQPPICFVDFTNLVGWRNIPVRMYQFFRQRDKVRHGAELALTLVYGTKQTAREFQPGHQATFPGQVLDTPPQGGDLDWGLDSEQRYPPYFLNSDNNIAHARESYYKALPKLLKDARDLARGLRQASKIEKNDPSKTEAELRQERFNKEKEWTNAQMGFEIIRPGKGVEWDERFRGSLRVLELSSEVRQQIDREQRLRNEANKQMEHTLAAQEKALKQQQAQRQKELESQPPEELPTGI